MAVIVEQYNSKEKREKEREKAKKIMNFCSLTSVYSFHLSLSH